MGLTSRWSNIPSVLYAASSIWHLNETNEILPCYLFDSVAEGSLAKAQGPIPGGRDAMKGLKAYDPNSYVEAAISFDITGMYLAYLLAIGFLPLPSSSGKANRIVLHQLITKAPKRP